ncbi:MAG: HAD hydrolase family protein [Chloroflexaceae bacterium]
MHIMTLACDLDGTLAEHGQVAPETWELLQRLKGANWRLILVTGRTLKTFTPHGPFTEVFDAIVAEDGAVVYFPHRDIVTLPFGRLNPALIDRLADLGVPLERGLAIVATYTPHDLVVLKVLHEVAGGATVEYNRGAVMVLPPGATKSTGLRYALRELGCSPRSVIACGDAENDRSLFECAELAVAVSNATEEVRALADVVLPAPDGAGVRALGEGLLRNELPAYRQRPERMLPLGERPDRTPVLLDPFWLLDGTLAIVGASGGGKSWLAGLLAEELLRRGYQICLIDPEGDYRAMRAFPHTLLLGGASAPLPPVSDIVTLSEYAETSLVLDLSLETHERRMSYVAGLLHELGCLRARHGRPHWLLIDEVQSFCLSPEHDAAAVLCRLVREGGVGIVSYQPGRLPRAILEAIDHWLVTRLVATDEQESIAAHLAQCPGWIELEPSLAALPRGQAYLCVDSRSANPAPPQLVHFRARPRTVPHIRHLHKYLRAPLPYDKRFHFHDGQGRYLGESAANLWELRAALTTLPLDSLRYHVERGDLERWVTLVLRDHELGRQIGKITRRHLQGEALRQALVAVVGERYDELDSLI